MAWHYNPMFSLFLLVWNPVNPRGPQVEDVVADVICAAWELVEPKVAGGALGTIFAHVERLVWKMGLSQHHCDIVLKLVVEEHTLYSSTYILNRIHGWKEKNQ